MKKLVVTAHDSTARATAAAVARALARGLGHDDVTSACFATATAELTSNVARHGGGGIVTLQASASELRVDVVDRGNGAPEVLRACVLCPRDSSGGLGHGLGAVSRLMTELHIEARSGGGLHVSAKRAI